MQFTTEATQDDIFDVGAFLRTFDDDLEYLILDEATANVDTRTEVVIQRALKRLLNRTSFVIAHRLSTVHGADRVVVLDGGRIVESGTHNELLELRTQGLQPFGRQHIKGQAVRLRRSQSTLIVNGKLTLMLGL